MRGLARLLKPILFPTPIVSAISISLSFSSSSALIAYVKEAVMLDNVVRFVPQHVRIKIHAVADL
jgi:hypothetical protein